MFLITFLNLIILIKVNGEQLCHSLFSNFYQIYVFIDIEQWRAILKSFSQKFLAVCTGKCRPALGIVNYRIISLLCMLLLTHGDVKPNPGSEKKLTIFLHVAIGMSAVYWHIKNLFS